MLTRLTVSTDERLLPLVRAYGGQVSRAMGLSDEDASRLAEAVDEVVRFVRERAYPGDPAGTSRSRSNPPSAASAWRCTTGGAR